MDEISMWRVWLAKEHEPFNGLAIILPFKKRSTKYTSLPIRRVRLKDIPIEKLSHCELQERYDQLLAEHKDSLT